MRFTIIGSHGFIGRNLVSLLQQSDHEVLCMDRNTIFDPHEDYGTVFYCAGVKTDIDKRVFDVIEAHVSLPAFWLKNAKFSHFVYLSSTRIYGKQPQGIESERNFQIDADDLYNTTKILGETVCLKSNRSVSIIRLSHVVGYDPSSKIFLWSLLNQAKNNESLHIEEDPTMERDYIVLEEVVQALIEIAKHKSQGIFNFVSGYPTQNRQITEIINRYRPMKSITFGSKKVDFAKFCNEKLRAAINFKFSNAIETIDQITREYLIKS
jgi:nucleoside-diphosphate-sugar epimerase